MGTSPFEKPPKEAEKARGELNPTSHVTDLFDQQEDVHGARVDEASGRPIDNTQQEAEDEKQEAEIDLTPLPKGQNFFDENDEAAEFLKTIKK